MSDEFMPEEHDADLAEGEPEEERSRRDIWGLVAAIAAIVIVVVVLLMLRDCGGKDGGTDSAGGKTIESVDGMSPTEGLVSVWISDSLGIGTALSKANVSATDRIDLGGGRYVLGVAKGTEDAVVSRLVAVKGVYDAGLVYETAGTAK